VKFLLPVEVDGTGSKRYLKLITAMKKRNNHGILVIKINTGSDVIK
jgi:hypothetical protein